MDGWVSVKAQLGTDTSLSLPGLVDALTPMINALVALLDRTLLSAVRVACKQLAELKKPFGRRCQSPGTQPVFGRCCQALLAAPEVQRFRLVSFIHEAERTWLTSILPSSAQPAGLVSWYFWDSPCPGALKVPNPPSPGKIQPQAG